MTGDGLAEARGSLWSSIVSLFAASGTLVCCAIPALLVTVGAGAALASLVSVFPEVVWLSEHAAEVFGLAVAAVLMAGVLQWRNRNAPCPADPAARQACLRVRAASLRLYAASVACLVVGGGFAFVLPVISR